MAAFDENVTTAYRLTRGLLPVLGKGKHGRLPELEPGPGRLRRLQPLRGVEAADGRHDIRNALRLEQELRLVVSPCVGVDCAIVDLSAQSRSWAGVATRPG